MPRTRRRGILPRRNLAQEIEATGELNDPIVHTKQLQFRKAYSIISLFQGGAAENSEVSQTFSVIIFTFWGGITMPIGPWELIVILIIALLVFGPKRLPDMGRSLGKAIREFRNAGKEIQNDIAESIDENERDSTKSANKTV